MRYLPPGSPPTPPPAAQPNSYRQPTGTLQQAQPPSQTQPAPLPPPTPARDQDPHHASLLAEWHLRHGDTWIRADALSPTIRHVIDPKDRTAAIRQRLRQLANAHRELETKTTGNAARPVRLYRLAEIAELEG
jgi:hypothetical protein